MANLAPLVIKLVANMDKAKKDFNAMSKTIASIEKSVKSATTSMKKSGAVIERFGMVVVSKTTYDRFFST